jgi:glycine/D-amino acid oxidase-like deaminating enzyme
MSGTAVILGAGVVGLACGRALQRDGFRVTVVDRAGPGEGASFGNASQIATASVIPQATPGILRQTLRLLRDPHGPLVARPAYVARHLPWFLRFIAKGHVAAMREGAEAMSALLGQAWPEWLPILQDIGADHLVKRSGALHVFRSAQVLAGARAMYDLRRELGVPSVELDAAGARALEPALSPGIAGAVHVPGMGYVTDTLALSRSFVDRIQRDGGKVLRATATGIDQRGVLTADGRVDADLVVVAAGAWSNPFTRQLGLRIPMVSERGYHLMYARDRSAVRMPLLLVERKTAVTPMEGGIRVASMAEFTDPDAAADHLRAEPVLTGLGEWLPGLDGEPTSRWVGPRPSMPDSRPVIGRAPRCRNVLLAFGHGHLGLTLAALTGRAIADLASDREPAVDLASVSPDRFRVW